MENPKTIVEKLAYVQARLHAPKGQFNKFGGYAYRSAEDILEAVKPILGEVGLALTITDSIEELTNGWVYVRATAAVQDATGAALSSTAWAREPEQRKGMDAAQVTGSSSSYARKYALNGLFAIDDARDPDATNDHGKGATQPKAATPPAKATAKKPAPKGGRDYGALKAVTEQLAAIHGRSVPEEYREIARMFGDPKTKTDEEYADLVAALEAMKGNEQ